jgi:hypothetical protein
MTTTKSEIVKIITAIKVQCPEAIPYKTSDELDMVVNTWFEVFKAYPKEVVWVATTNALKSTVFQKQNWLGAIYKEIENLQIAYEKSETELWAELTGVLREVHRNYYAFRFNAMDANGKTQGDNARDRVEAIFNGLSPELKEYCRNQRGLIEIAEYDAEKLSFERGRFMRDISNIKTRVKTRHLLPDNVATLLQGIASNMAIEGGERKLLE